MPPLTSADEATLVGAVLSRRYRLTKLLGVGGMGSVYAAQAVTGGQSFAVKLLHPEFHGEPVVVSRFVEEGRSCQRLVHPNVIRVFEAAQAEDGSMYLVMELLDGAALADYVEGGRRIPAPAAAAMVQGILAGLSAAHALGVVHRDLKPENVFITRDGQGSAAVKVLDFGIAKVMDAAGGMGTKTKTGVLLGTPAYMSPEQIRSAKEVDARSDLWSVGVLFYEMVTGRSPFPAPNEFARLSSVLMGTYEPVERVDPQLAPLGPFFARVLEKDRSRRFQSAQEMAQALAAATGAPAVTATGEAGRPGTMPLSAVDAQAFRPSMQTPQPLGGFEPANAPTPRYDGAPRPMVGGRPAHGTLASPSQSVGPLLEPAPNVIYAGPVAVPPASRSTGRSGVAAGLVIALVAGALAAGFILGFAVGRM